MLSPDLSAESGDEISLDAYLDVVRNAQPASATAALATHGLEFEQLDAAQQLALKSYVFDRIDDISHWSNAARPA